jgi:hypothetical protein
VRIRTRRLGFGAARGFFDLQRRFHALKQKQSSITRTNPPIGKGQMNTLEIGGVVPLWSGWKVELPGSRYELNPDKSWSAWGADWTFDITIIDTSGDASGDPVSAEQLRGPVGSSNEIVGEGWVGLFDLNDEIREGQKVHVLSAKLCSVNSVLLGTVSFFDVEKTDFARNLLGRVSRP